MTKPWVLHIDGDGFFAYCEISRFPHLKGKPVVVGEDRGIACAMTYEAKKLGITRGMPIFKIREQFPEVVRLSSHFELYEHYANKLAHILEPELDVLERYSIDECFGLINLPESWTKEEIVTWLRNLKRTVQSQLGLTYSFGLARTKVLAKVASKREKPDGCTVIMTEEETSILKEVPIESLWGIGWKLSRRLANNRVRTAYDFSQWPEKRVQDNYALPVQELWHELHGRKMFSVGNDTEHQKSLQATKSFTPATTSEAFLIAELLQNADIAFTRMRQANLVTNGLSVYLKTTERKYHSTSILLPHYTASILDVGHKLREAVQALVRPGTRYKSTGITLWNLRPSSYIQEDLFGHSDVVREEHRVMEAVDTIRGKFGQGSITVLASMPSVIDREKKRAVRAKNEPYIAGLPLPYLGEVY
jgi:DNA polymerase-4/DNA polymerase V